MKPKRVTISPEIEARIVALREAGYTNIAIAKHLRIGVRTVQRHLARLSVKKGIIKDALIDQAREDALLILRSDPLIRETLAKLIIDDLAHVAHIREIIVEASEFLQATDVRSAALVMRGAAAYSTALKNTSEILQKHFEKSTSDNSDSVPELVIKELTADQLMDLKSHVSGIEGVESD